MNNVIINNQYLLNNQITKGYINLAAVFLDNRTRRIIG